MKLQQTNEMFSHYQLQQVKAKCMQTKSKRDTNWAVVVAQLVEQLLTTPEVRGSNPVICKIYIERLQSSVFKK